MNSLKKAKSTIYFFEVLSSTYSCEYTFEVSEFICKWYTEGKKDIVKPITCVFKTWKKKKEKKKHSTWT